MAEMTFLYHPTHTLKRNAFRLVPRDRTLARVGFAWPPLERLLEEAGPSRRRGLIRLTPTPAQARVLLAALRSTVTLLTARGWR
jgi:hypothetical protein